MSMHKYRVSTLHETHHRSTAVRSYRKDHETHTIVTHTHNRPRLARERRAHKSTLHATSARAHHAQRHRQAQLTVTPYSRSPESAQNTRHQKRTYSEKKGLRTFYPFKSPPQWLSKCLRQSERSGAKRLAMAALHRALFSQMVLLSGLWIPCFICLGEESVDFHSVFPAQLFRIRLKSEWSSGTQSLLGRRARCPDESCVLFARHALKRLRYSYNAHAFRGRGRSHPDAECESGDRKKRNRTPFDTSRDHQNETRRLKEIAKPYPKPMMVCHAHTNVLLIRTFAHAAEESARKGCRRSRPILPARRERFLGAELCLRSRPPPDVSSDPSAGFGANDVRRLSLLRRCNSAAHLVPEADFPASIAHFPIPSPPPPWLRPASTCSHVTAATASARAGLASFNSLPVAGG
ncbi:hypothetical protein C7M84_010252 [Penaeus vannamei]|uniref:Uncharacterized protein n=1 Tax=Penaeus vannamei TaxID=6689 RepID=A0A423T4N7_PENVA|nr:hypothetical protein C7M84_010252 [Penaeus vannamei]